MFRTKNVTRKGEVMNFHVIMTYVCNNKMGINFLDIFLLSLNLSIVFFKSQVLSAQDNIFPVIVLSDQKTKNSDIYLDIKQQQLLLKFILRHAFIFQLE